VALIAGVGSAHGAVVEGDNGQQKGAATPPAAATPPPPGGTLPPGTPPGARSLPLQKFPGLNLPLGKRRRGDVATPPAPTTAAPAPTTAPAAAAAGAPASTAVTGSNALAGEKEFNSCKKFPAGKRIVKLNLKPDTELGDLISWISSITCRQFLLPGTIPANSKKVTVVAPELITPEEAYRLFLGALDSVGLTVAPSGKFLRIIETNRAKTSSIAFSSEDGEMPGGESYVTRLVRVENSDANEVAQVLGRLKSEQGDVIVYAPQGALIITDTSANVTRMLRILREIDQPGTGEKVWIITIHNTGASEMAQKLADIFQVAQIGGKKGGGAPAPQGKARPGDLTAEMMISKIIPDERSNQLIVIANERAYARVLQLVRKLDVPVPGGDGRIHVYYCEHANCDELGQTLGAVTGVTVTGATGGRSRSRGQGNQPAAAPAPSGGGQQQANFLFEGDVRINFDRPTNSLIIVSSLTDYQSVRRVIERLDSPRKQVFVEAMILEVTLDKQRELGAAWHGAKPENLFGLSEPSLIVGGLNASKTIFPASSLGETMLAGVLGPVLTPDEARSLGTSTTTTVDIPSFGVLIKALQSNSDVDVLSNPHLLIMNNEDGEISVGSRVPFPVSTLGLQGGVPGAGGAPVGFGNFGFPNVQREKVALELKLTPHVNEHDVIRLEVDEKISELAPSPASGGQNLGPSTSERTAKTIVVAKDQQTVLIGGLMSDKVINSVTKIPILGDIPILGFFFRTSVKKIVKTNLIIALTPYVINDQSDLRRVLEKKMKERREFIERFGGQERASLDAAIDYRRKRGMLEEINRATREIEGEEKEISDLRIKQGQDESGPVDLPNLSSTTSSFAPASTTTPTTPPGGAVPGASQAPAQPGATPTTPAAPAAPATPPPQPAGRRPRTSPTP
jgi:general secretion pathway protein D